MQKTTSITIQIKPAIRDRLDALAIATRRSQSFVIEDALERYLEINEWQIKGIQEAVEEADRPDAQWVDHEEVLARIEAKRAR